MARRGGGNGEAGTATAILDVAERLLQVRGYNGFSYADIAAELDVTTAALHYHFASKAELGEAVIARYAARFTDALASVDSDSADATERLRGYVAIYADVLRVGRMCLCGMLAADFQTLPAAMRDAVLGFFDTNETRLTWVLKAGAEDGVMRFAGPAEEIARVIVSTLEGAMLISRPSDDVARFTAAADRMIDGLIAL
jgi:TetR/AcrR family transcriptional regulator, transcriptional repressor for nem operon